MTDPIACPECGGKGTEKLGRLSLQCRFCNGAGQVGGDHEPAEEAPRRSDGFRQPREGESYDPAVHGPLPSVGSHPAVRRSGLCGQCLGVRKVLAPGHREVPCPACSTPRRAAG